MSEITRAVCRCGELRFSSPGKPVLQVRCHCSDCRSITTEPSVDTVFFRLQDAELQGEVETIDFVSATGNRTYRDVCPGCGVMMFDRSEGFPDLLGVNSAWLQLPFKTEISCHMWYASRVQDCDDNLPKFDAGIE